MTAQQRRPTAVRKQARPGPPPRRRLRKPPPTVQRACGLIFTGALLEVAKMVVLLVLATRPQYGELTKQGTTEVGRDMLRLLGALADIGLWIWMALAIRRGLDWARITGTVFFGVSCLAFLLDVSLFRFVLTALGGSPGALIATDAVLLLVGLAAVVLLWDKRSAPFFSPQPYHRGAVPRYYPQPRFETGTTMQDSASARQQPADPWSIPGERG